MFYYEHHIGDFIRDTARISDTQCMAYLRLLWMYYDTEKPLPNTPEKLAFQIGANGKDVCLILEHFFNFDSALGVWRHKRCDAEIEAYKAKKEKASKSANARWKNKETTQKNASAVENDADAMRTQCERNANAQKSDANQEPITNNHISKEEALLVSDTWFGASCEKSQADTPKKEPANPPKNEGKKAKRGTRLDAEWRLPKAWGEWALAEFPAWTADIVRAEADKFRDYWHAKTGRDATKADWLATWRNWCRSDIAQRAHMPQPTKTVTAHQESFRERDARLAAERVADFCPELADTKHLRRPAIEIFDDLEIIEVDRTPKLATATATAKGD